MQNNLSFAIRDAEYLLWIISEWEKHRTRYYLNLRSGAVTRVFWESLHILRKGRRRIYIFVKNCYYPEIGIYLVDFYANNLYKNFPFPKDSSLFNREVKKKRRKSQKIKKKLVTHFFHMYNNFDNNFVNNDFRE